MIDMSNKLKDLECPLPKSYVIHYIMMSLPSYFGNFKINYNSGDKNWTTTELIVNLSQEEEMLRTENGGHLVNFTKGSSSDHGKSGEKFSHQKGKGKKPYDPPKEAFKEDVTNEKKGFKSMHCKKYGNIRRECDEFKTWLIKKSNDFIFFIDESFFTDFSSNTWWINSGATVHVTNSSQGLLGARTTGRERSLQVANGREVKVEAVGTLPLLIHGGFTLYLNNVLYVLSLITNLISVASLEDDVYECLLENNKCPIKFDDVIIGLAPRRGILYMLSLNDFPVMNVCDVTNKRRRITTSDNGTSSKLWHCHLDHISRGRMECLIKEEILAPLDFSYLAHCIECIKGKYVKHIKKTRATCSSGVLQIIHTDICDPFNVKSVDWFNSFITVMDDISRYGYIYLIHERSKALDKFKIFKTEVEIQHNVKIKVVSSDREGEYYGRHTPYGKLPDHLIIF
jgi:hypothetical protein